MSDTLPEWLIKKIEEWKRGRKSGEIRIVMQDGGIRNILREYEKETVHPPTIRSI